MKTFTSIEAYPEGTCGFRDNGRKIYVIEADPKREGLYKMSEYQVSDSEKTQKFSKYYGKCNQAKIIELSKNMIEVI